MEPIWMRSGEVQPDDGAPGVPLDHLRTKVLARELTRSGQGGILPYRDVSGNVTLEIELPDRAVTPRSRNDTFMDVPHLDEAQAARTQFLLEELRSMRVGAYTSAEGRGNQRSAPR